MEKRLIPAILILFLCGAMLGCAKKQEVLATVGDVVITKAAFDGRISKLPPEYQRIARIKKKDFLNEMVLEILLVDEANKRNLQNDREVKELLDETKKKILIAKLLDDETKRMQKPSEAELQTYYEAHKDEFLMPERYRASHIMVETQAEAENVLAKIKEGASFEELAKEKSTDPSKEQGGDIGYFTKGQLLPEFEEVVIKLNLGEVSGVVKTPLGYHVIKLTDKQEARTASLDEVKQRIEAQISSEKKKDTLENLIKNLKDKSKVAIHEELLEETGAEGTAAEKAESEASKPSEVK